MVPGIQSQILRLVKKKKKKSSLSTELFPQPLILQDSCPGLAFGSVFGSKEEGRNRKSLTSRTPGFNYPGTECGHKVGGLQG